MLSLNNLKKIFLKIGEDSGYQILQRKHTDGGWAHEKKCPTALSIIFYFLHYLLRIWKSNHN